MAMGQSLIHRKKKKLQQFTVYIFNSFWQKSNNNSNNTIHIGETKKSKQYGKMFTQLKLKII